MACSKIEDNIDNPLEIELLALSRGLQVCLPLGIQTLRVETDSLCSRCKLVNEGE